MLNMVDCFYLIYERVKGTFDSLVGNLLSVKYHQRKKTIIQCGILEFPTQQSWDLDEASSLFDPAGDSSTYVRY